MLEIKTKLQERLYKDLKHYLKDRNKHQIEINSVLVGKSTERDKMSRLCELKGCPNDAYLFVEMYSLASEGLVIDPVAVCFDCYEEYGLKEY